VSGGLPLPLPDPPLGDGLVSLRAWQPGDAPALAAAWADPDVARWTGVPDGDRGVERAARWIAGEADRRQRGLALDLVVTAGDEVVGEVGIARVDTGHRIAEAGWWLTAPARGRGLAGRAVGLFATWAVTELCVDQLYARLDPANPASAGVAARAGFERRGLGQDGLEVWATARQVALLR
jgi:RimJ/RimL family protein N-acetyltransferase